MSESVNVDPVWLTDASARETLRWFVRQYVKPDRYWAARAVLNAGTWLFVPLEDPVRLVATQDEYEQRLISGEPAPLPAYWLDWPEWYDDGLTLHKVRYYVRFKANRENGHITLRGYELLASLEEEGTGYAPEGEDRFTTKDIKDILENQPKAKENEFVRAVLAKDWERARGLLDAIDPEAFVPDVAAGHDVPLYWHLTRLVVSNQELDGSQPVELLDALYERVRDLSFHDKDGRTVATWLALSVCRKEDGVSAWLPLLVKVLAHYRVPSYVSRGPSVLGYLLTNIHCVLNAPAVREALQVLAQHAPDAFDDPVPWDELPDNVDADVLRLVSQYRSVPASVVRMLPLMVSRTFYV